MEKHNITLKRFNAPDWVFSWDYEFNGLVHRTKHNIYRLFSGDMASEHKPIWIGRLSDDKTAWVTWEKELKAKAINLCGCTIFFDT